MARRHAIGAAAWLLAVAAWMWLAMMLIHELGHVMAAHLTGGRIASLELRPGYLSHTLVAPNPRPRVVAWSGFLVGWIAPQLTAPWWRCDRGMVGPVLRAWAAFCLLAGGCYLAVAGGERFTDTGQLVSAGWPLAWLVVVGVTVAAVGYIRSRIAWVAIAERLEAAAIDHRVVVGWWVFLTLWWGGQNLLHATLLPVGNVR